MSRLCIHWPRFASSLPKVRFIISSQRINFDHFIPAACIRFFKYIGGKPRLPVRQRPLASPVLGPQLYDSQSSTWAAVKDSGQKALQRGSVVKVASWNIDWSSPGPAARASAALEHLKDRFGENTSDLVIMLQEVCHESQQAILENPWVQQNFILSDVDPPESLYKDVLGNSFILKRLEWRAAPYFTLMMISRHLSIGNCFRVPFVTEMGRDALVVDIPLFNPDEQTQPKEYLRLCTTHLESLWEGKSYRLGQLALISELLKATPTMESRIIAGLVGGDMNAIDQSEDEFPKASDVDLKDVWEGISTPPPVLKPFQKDLSYGRAKGNTWGYQSKKPRARKRMDKFLYTGSIETVALREAQDVSGRLGRLGIHLKTDVEAWEGERRNISVVRGRYVEKVCKEYYSERVATRLKGQTQLVRTKINTWVSDHFGITVDIKVH